MKLFQLLGATALISTLPLTPALAQNPTTPSGAQTGTQNGSTQETVIAPVGTLDPATTTSDAQGGNPGGNDVVVTGSRIR